MGPTWGSATAEIRSHFRRDGFVVVQGVFDDFEVRALRRACDAAHHARRNSWLSALGHDRRLHALLQTVLGEDAALLGDRLIDGAGGRTLRQAYAGYRHAGVPAEAIAVAFVAIDAATETRGAFELFACRDPRAVQGAERFVAAMEPGDVLLFHPLTPHRRAPDSSGAPRRVLQLVYNRARYGSRRLTSTSRSPRRA